MTFCTVFIEGMHDMPFEDFVSAFFFIEWSKGQEVFCPGSGFTKKFYETW